MALSERPSERSRTDGASILRPLFVRVSCVGELTLGDFGDVLPRRVQSGLAQVGEALEKLWLEAVRQPEHVATDEDLAVTVGTGTDTDRRDRVPS